MTFRVKRPTKVNNTFKKLVKGEESTIKQVLIDQKFGYFGISLQTTFRWTDQFAFINPKKKRGEKSK